MVNTAQNFCVRKKEVGIPFKFCQKFRLKRKKRRLKSGIVCIAAGAAGPRMAELRMAQLALTPSLVLGIFS